MPRDEAFEVVGHEEEIDGEEVEGSVLGTILGASGGRSMRLRRRPGWRGGSLAPGVETPGEGMVPLPLTPNLNGGVFNAATPAITFTGQLQKPFRGERVLISVVRTGTTAVGAVLAQIYVGTDLQQADVQPIAIEALAQGNSFGTRLTLHQAPPGVLIRFLCTLQSNPTGTDTVSVAFTVLGRIIH